MRTPKQRSLLPTRLPYPYLQLLMRWYNSLFHKIFQITPTPSRFCKENILNLLIPRIRRGRGVPPFPAVLLAVFLAAVPFWAQQRTAEEQQSYRQAMEKADKQIDDEMKAHSELVKNLEYLTTQIGPRLTGSPQMQAASAWTLKRFQDYGIDAHLESADIAHSWTRGVETAEITSPIQRSIGIRAMGWSKATHGDVSGNVVALDIHQPSDFDAYKGKLKGAIVLTTKPADLSKAEANPENAYDAVIPLRHGLKPAGMSFRERAQLIHRISEEQPALVLLDSGKPDSLFNMTGGFNSYQPSPAPIAFLTHEDYDLVWRLLQAGPVKMSA